LPQRISLDGIDIDAYREAYIEPIELPGAYEDTVSFQRELTAYDVEWSIGDWDNSYDVSSGDSFWTVLVVNCYQPNASEDNDPDDETSTAGKTTGLSLYNKCVIYLETINDVPYEASHIMIHEMGHAGGCCPVYHCSDESCIMEAGANGSVFCNDHKNEIRKDANY